MKRFIIIIISLTLLSNYSYPQLFKKKQIKQPEKKAETTKKISDFITKEAKTSKGIFIVHTVKGKLYFEIPKKEFGKEFLIVTRIAQTPGIGYGGENTNNQVVRWEMQYDKLLLRSVSYQNTASDTMPIYKAVKNSNFEPIIKSFDILAYSSDSLNILIEVTSLYLEDVFPFNLPDYYRKSLEVKAIDKSRCFLDLAKAYPQNVEIKALLTYVASRPNQLAETQSISIKIHHSMILLPEVPMKSRYFDSRIGYFALYQTNYGDKHQVENNKYIVRWRLEPKPEDMDKFLRGELVEPAKPIVYYIDPATPVKWRAALKKGIEDWQPAFEAAGFKNAIIAKDSPSLKEDPDWNPEDARYSVIRYFASPVMNAYGPNVHDPRSGEILESDIGWYHNVLNLLRNWYFIQAAGSDKKAQKLPLSDSLMCELVRYVCAHEVGHTLGLRHNMKASHFYPTDSLRSKTFTKKYGTTPSIMDYARFNYVAQPGDDAYMLPIISEYDKLSIKWGYKPIPSAKTPEDEKPVLNNWLKVQETTPMLRFGFEGRNLDPYAQSEDLGDDAIKATSYGVKNLERIMGLLVQATEKKGEDFDLLKEMYYTLVGQWRMEMAHVANYVGGIEVVEKVAGQEGRVYDMIPAQKQKEAIKFIADNAFNAPAFLLNQDIVRKFEPTGSADRIIQAQQRLLQILMDDNKLLRIYENEILNPANFYKLSEVFNDLYLSVWSSLNNKNIIIDPYKRALQQEYIRLLEAKLKNQNALRTLARLQLSELKTKINSSLSKASDIYTKAHLNDCVMEIERILNPKN
ncbi:MAG: zinc-dependent metalloprotease [Bacteroidales bacterium]|nr:zinc-dependent metalloprotease [Bacteroidales bacterium]